ncbi:MAG: beta-galactosidase, partial [Oscillospiraceae bacterium]|nr:beta-galactosidase [Oscillospiraceae bacterium]
EAGIDVVLGTPSATPPIWLEEMDPSMHRLDENRLQELHGGRRHCCSNNPTYVKYSLRIAEEMAKELGHHPALIGWQIDNEIAIIGNGCFCDNCRAGFHRYLEKKYGTVESLNARWNLTLFSQAYERFDQIPLPDRLTWHNPHLLMEWRLFQSDSHIDFVHAQEKVLRPYTDQPISTDMMPIFTTDYEKTLTFLDLVQFNHYNTKENLRDVCFWFDLIRPLKERPFWNTETSTCWNGHIRIAQTVKPEGFCVANSWLPVAMGGEANMYWLWRQHWAGHELTHGSVLSPAGRPLHIFGEVQKTSAGYEKAADFLKNTRVAANAALQVSSLNDEMHLQQPIVPEANSEWGGLYSARLRRYFYHPMTDAGLRPDVIHPSKSLDDYKLIVSPLMMTMEEKGLPARMTEWVRNGGVWVIGPLTDIRNDIGAHYTDREMGFAEELTGVQLCYQLPDAEHDIPVTWQDGTPFGTDMWLQVYDAPEDAEVLAAVNGGHSALVGKAVALKKKVGKGTVYFVGTFPTGDAMEKIMTLAAKDAGIPLIEHSPGVTAVPREGAQSGLVLVEHDAKPGYCRFDGKMTDLLTGETFDGKADLAPYQVMVLVRT